MRSTIEAGFASSLEAAVFLLIPLYLGFFLFIGWAREFLVNRAFWIAAADTMTVENLAGADAVLAQAQKDERAVGEGFADAIDFGGV